VENTQPRIDELQHFPKQPAVGDTIDFISSVSGGNSGAASLEFNWDFGDGTANTAGSKVSHTYSSSGDYTVELTVTDADGDTTTETTTVSVAEN
jgi:chitinase